MWTNGGGVNRRLLYCTLALLACCSSTPGWEQRGEDAARLALDAGWQSQRIAAGDFDLQAWFSPRREGSSQGKNVTVYIEGDGFAWVNRNRPSDNPTPRSPVALELALAQPRGNAAYLARPCQYLDAGAQDVCSQEFWTGGRFSEPVIRASNEAVELIKRHFGSETVTLVGYSGGGAVAILVAARRDDVVKVVTVAGNLDHARWTGLHGLAPLASSLNPADAWQRVQDIPQLHYVGSADAVMPASIAEAYRQRFSDDRLVTIEVISGFDHQCCWSRDWASLGEDWLAR